eukprot:TRINITY_DN4250_c0_g5_i4.p1 TRINITY_DN4250_c0_g5~~TRINITY_DN4250_c0_g5_i4.p1  ORF type:complete len:219 (+),score=61.33 TRINITY_DN4250_c0_g5_i4:147-803(+)
MCIRDSPQDCPSFTDGISQLEYYGYSTSESTKWFALLKLVGFLGFFLTVTVLLFHYKRYDLGPTSGGVRRPDESTDEVVATKPECLRKQHMQVALSFSDLTYDVPIPNQDGTGTRQLRLLRQCFGFFVPGTATCLMGSSGAGKTTLMDVIAGLKTGGVVGGDIWVNHEPLLELQDDGTLVQKPTFRRYVGYVEQSDIHVETQTVREALGFAAATRHAP